MTKREEIAELKRCLQINLNRKLWNLCTDKVDGHYDKMVSELKKLIDLDYLDRMDILEIAVNIIHLLDDVVGHMSIVDKTTVFIQLELICNDVISDAEYYERFESCSNIKYFIEVFNKIRI